jgi:hypothetical protein
MPPLRPGRRSVSIPKEAREPHHLVKTKTPKLIITPLEPMTEIQPVRLFRMMASPVMHRGLFQDFPVLLKVLRGA